MSFLLLLGGGDPPVQPGFRSLLAFWMGGASVVVAGSAKPWLYRQHTHTIGVGFVRAQ
jgi:hypothetical protein